MFDSSEPSSTAHKGPVTKDRGQLAPALIASLVGIALYAVTLGGTYIYDDIYHLFNDWRSQAPRGGPPAIEDPAHMALAGPWVNGEPPAAGS